MHPLDKIFKKTKRTPLEKCIVKVWYKTGDRAFCETAAAQLARYEAIEKAALPFVSIIEDRGYGVTIITAKITTEEHRALNAALLLKEG